MPYLRLRVRWFEIRFLFAHPSPRPCCLNYQIGPAVHCGWYFPDPFRPVSISPSGCLHFDTAWFQRFSKNNPPRGEIRAAKRRLAARISPRGGLFLENLWNQGSILMIHYTLYIVIDYSILPELKLIIASHQEPFYSGAKVYGWCDSRWFPQNWPSLDPATAMAGKYSGRMIIRQK